jgi:hypothetical protein
MSAGAYAENAPAKTDNLSFPYMAVVTGDNLYVRSGPGTNYYQCGKLSKDDKVKVVSTQYVWSRIVPPAGSFSWIAVKYVSIDLANPTVGTVTGSNVRVWAGSSDYKPIHSTTQQGKLGTGDKVTLLGEQQGDYYKIAPPAFAYLWIATEFLTPYTPTPEDIAPQTARPVSEPEAPAADVVKPTQDANAPQIVESTPAKIVENTIEDQRIAQYHQLLEKVKAERGKPISQQSYDKLKAELGEIVNDNDAGKASRYAKFILQQIVRYELAINSADILAKQTAETQKITGKIEQARLEKLKQLGDKGKYAAVGKLQVSEVYAKGIKHWRLVGKDGKSICYVIPRAENFNLKPYIDKKVGLVGSITAHEPTSGALVTFTEVNTLE